MEWTKEMARQYVGQWVQCHSVYGMHAGYVHRALRDGIVIIHHTQLSAGQPARPADFDHAPYDPGTGADIRQVQFLLPAPGLFVPYGGIYGLWPRPPFFI